MAKTLMLVPPKIFTRRKGLQKKKKKKILLLKREEIKNLYNKKYLIIFKILILYI